jgi:hypothetical protein
VKKLRSSEEFACISMPIGGGGSPVEIAHAAEVATLPLASCENRKMNRHNSHSENWFFKQKKS